jgi:hypothetical protein
MRRGNIQPPEGFWDKNNGGERKMANLNEMSKTEMRLEINAAEAVVNNGGTLSQEQWDRVFKMLQLVKEG